MEKYNKLLANIRELIEKSLFNSKDLKKEVENLIKLKAEELGNKFNFVSREEFEVQKKMIENLRKDITTFKSKKDKKKSKQAKRS